MLNSVSALLTRFAAIAALTLLAPVTAWSQAPLCERTKVFFVNGVLNARDKAGIGRTELENALREHGVPAEVRPGLIWNPGDGPQDDLMEVAISNEWSKTRAAFVAGVLTTGSVPALVAHLNARAASTRSRKVIEKIKGIVLSEIRDRKRPVVLVAHSQGNIYVNAAVRELQSDPATRDIPGIGMIGVIGVGVADTEQAGVFHRHGVARAFYRYLTSVSDRVMGGVIGELPGNFVPAENASHEISHHYFVETYLQKRYVGNYNGEERETSSRTKIAELFKAVYGDIQQAWPCLMASSTPNPSRPEQQVTFEVKATPRPGETATLFGVVKITGAGSSPVCEVYFYNGPSGTCQHAFAGPARIESIQVSYFDAAPLILADGMLTDRRVLEQRIDNGDPPVFTGPVALTGPAGISNDCPGTYSVTANATLTTGMENRLRLVGSEEIALSCTSFTGPIDVTLTLTRSGDRYGGTFQYPFTCNAPCISGSVTVTADLALSTGGGVENVTGTIVYRNENRTPFLGEARGGVSLERRP